MGRGHNRTVAQWDGKGRGWEYNLTGEQWDGGKIGRGHNETGVQWDGKGQGWEYNGTRAQWDGGTLGGRHILSRSFCTFSLSSAISILFNSVEFNSMPTMCASIAIRFRPKFPPYWSK